MEDAAANNPWVTNILGIQKAHWNAARNRAQEESDDCLEEGDEYTVLGKAIKHIYQTRFAIGVQYFDMGNDFVIRHEVGSKFGASKVGVRSEGNGHVGTDTKKGLPRDWCVRYGVTQSTTFSVKALGGDAVAAFTLAGEWCRRHQWYYNLWLNMDDSLYTYTQGDLDSYKPTQEWLDFKATVGPFGAIAERLAMVESIQPGMPRRVKGGSSSSGA